MARRRAGRGPLHGLRGPRPRPRRPRARPHLEPGRPTEPLPLLVAHDGPEYDKLALLTRYSGAMIAAGTLPPHRVALLSPGPRDEWYSASALYSRALYVDVIPGLREAVPVEGAAGRHGRQPRRARDARHPAARPGHVRRAVPAVRQLLHAALRLARSPASPATARIVRVVRRILRAREHPDPVPVQLTCGTAEENVFNNRVMARALAEQGYEARLDEVPDMHNYTGWRDAFDPHLTRLLARSVDVRHAELYSPAIGAAGNVLVYGHYGRPVLVFPAEGGSAVDWDSQGDGARGRRPARGRPLQALLRRRVRLRRPRRLRVVGHRPGGAVHPRRPRRPAGHPHHRHAAWAPSTPPTSCSGGRTCSPPRICMSGNYEFGAHRRGGRLPRRPPRLDPLARELPAGLRAGHVGGHHRRAREHEAPRLAAAARRASRTSSTYGDTTSRTTGRHGARRSRIICPGSADGRDATPDRTAARHRGGLAARVRDAARPARARSRTPPARPTTSTSSGSRSSRSTCATSRATTSSSTGSPTGTSSRASG